MAGCISFKAEKKSIYHPHIHQSPLNLYKSYTFNARAHKVAATVNLVAMLMIAPSILAAASLSSMTYLPVFLFCLTFSIPILGVWFTSLTQKSYDLSKEAKIYKGMVKKYNEIPKTSLEPYIRKMGLPSEVFTSNEGIDYRPILSRFTFWNDYHIHLVHKAEKYMNNVPKSAKGRKYCVLRAHRIYEAKALKAKLFEAYALHVLKYPRTKQTLENKGVLQICTFEDRCVMNLFEKKDTYFRLNKNKGELSREEIISSDIFSLEQKIFDPD